MSNASVTAERPILVVDDDISTRKLLKGVLAPLGYPVVEVGNGLDAVEAFAAIQPSLVLMDVMMPEMDGFQACEKIRQIDASHHTPVIMMTGDDDHSAVDRAFDVGATDFITKPINWSLLKQRVRYFLRTGAFHQELILNRTRQAAARRIAKLVFWAWDLNDNSLQWSDDLESILKVPINKIGRAEQFFHFIHPDDQQRILREMDMVRAGADRMEVELRLLINKQERVVRMLGERSLDSRSHENVLFGALQDITEMYQREQTIKRMEYYDELTTLGNRRLFLLQINELQHERLRSKSTDTLLVGWIDLVKFNRHNEVFGEAKSDALLRGFALRLVQVLDRSDRVFRVGGDEFGILHQVKSEEGAQSFIDYLLAKMGEPFFIGNEHVFLVCSIGGVLVGAESIDAHNIIDSAQDAQRNARNRSRTVVLVNVKKTTKSKTSDLLMLERYLYNAMDKEEFFLVYQPQMNLRSGKIIGVEASLRWQHPERGSISPAEFIPILEDTGLIGKVGQWVLEEGCRQAAAWSRKGLQLRLGMNLSPRQFLEPKLEKNLQDAMSSSGVDPKFIELEITESMAMQDPKHAIDLFRRLQQDGVKIAIDDFGVGHSSLEYLLRFPINAIKIDRTFVINITQEIADRAIVRAVTAIGETLGLTIIAEGVEDLRQCDFVEALGASEIQGYLIGKPMLPEQIEDLVASFVRPGLTELKKN